MGDRLLTVARIAVQPGILRDNLVLFGLSMVVNALGFIFQFVMARLLSPGEWAEMVAALSLLALLSVPGTALNSLIIKIAGDLFVRGEGDRLWRWVVITGFRIGGFGLLVGVVLSLVSGWISRLLQFDGSSSVIVVGLAFVLSILAIVIKGGLAGTSAFSVLGLVGVVETMSRLLAGVMMVMLGWAAAGAIAGTAVGAFMATIVVLRSTAFVGRQGSPVQENLSSSLQVEINCEYLRSLLPLL